MNLKFFESYLMKEFKGVLPSKMLISNTFARDEERYYKKINGVEFHCATFTNNLENSVFNISIDINKDVSFHLTVWFNWEDDKKPFKIALYVNGGSLSSYGYMHFYHGSFKDFKTKDFEHYVEFLKILLKISGEYKL